MKAIQFNNTKTSLFAKAFQTIQDLQKVLQYEY